MDQVLIALSGAAVTALSAWLIYLAKRKRDEPETDTTSAVAASEVWAEYAERMEQRLEKAEAALDSVREAFEECREGLRALRAELNGKP